MYQKMRHASLWSVVLSLLVCGTSFAQFHLDHFKVYQLERERARAQVKLQGQFDKEPLPAEVVTLKLFANPVSKNGEPIVDKNAHLTWYQIRTADEPRRVVVIENQFGKQELLLGAPMFLAAPALKKERGAEFPKRLDHFKIYRVLEGKPVGKRVKLADQFGQQEAEVRRPVFFGVPVVKFHNDRVHKIQNEKDHLTVYELTPEVSEKKISVADQFTGDESREVLVTRAVMLAVPTDKLRMTVPPEPPKRDPRGETEPPAVEFDVDHFRFYLTAQQRVEFQIRLGGQFEDYQPVPAVLTAQTHFANPTRKDKTGVQNRHAHFTFYRLEQDDPGPKIAVKLNNQFGEQKLVLGRPVALLAPAEKVEEGSKFPEGLDHYKCYEVLRGEPIGKVVKIEDQFNQPHEVEVAKPLFFCVPARKIHKDKAFGVKNTKVHLTIYQTTATPDAGETRKVIDQFDTHKLRITRGVWLGVPSEKTAFEKLD